MADSFTLAQLIRKLIDLEIEEGDSQVELEVQGNTAPWSDVELYTGRIVLTSATTQKENSNGL